MKRRLVIVAAVIAAATLISSAVGSPAGAANIVDEWASVKPPPGARIHPPRSGGGMRKITPSQARAESSPA